MKTSEMIAMLEKNPKLIYESHGSGLIRAVVSSTGILDFENVIGGTRVDLKRNDWTLVREPVPVWEAIKALTEGKPVKCECQECCQAVKSVACTFYLLGLQSGLSLCSNGVLIGKWYIEDTPNA